MKIPMPYEKDATIKLFIYEKGNFQGVSKKALQ